MAILTRSLRSSTARRRGLGVLVLLGLGLGVLAVVINHAWVFALCGLVAVLLLVLGFIEARHVYVTYRAHELATREAHDGLWSWYPITKELNVSPRLLAMLGYTDDTVPNTYAWLALVHHDDKDRYNQTVTEHLKGKTPHFYCEYRVRGADGSYRWLASRGLTLRNRGGIGYLMAGSASDITERKASEERAHFMAHHDQLTGLGNRLLLADVLSRTLSQARRSQKTVAVLFADIDRFKNVNDSLGHANGDVLLMTLAQRLKEGARDSDTIIRQGGDEFIIVLPDISNVHQAHSVTSKILATIAQPVFIDGHELCVTSSIGVTFFPDDGQTSEELLRNADTAMYRAKEAGGNGVRFYTAAMNDAILQRVYLESGLRHAIEKNQLQLYLQAKIDIASGRLTGCEALLRWCNDEGRWVPPDEFIPVAEDSGLILPIGEWVLEQTIKLLTQWRGEGLRLPQVAINVSARQLWEPGLTQTILRMLGQAGLSPAQLEIEITESIFVRSDDESLNEIRRLAGAGVHLALDDFGTGYSSLSYLKQLPFDTLKIDRSFIQEIQPGQDGGDAIVAAVIAMARALGLRVVAEGVETPLQLQRLVQLQCDVAQGYLFSRPIPANEFARLYLQPDSEPHFSAGEQVGPGRTLLH
jgi:diguanylate cyclase (GGDEF)-like protein/PAS domain S-box-containing protein